MFILSLTVSKNCIINFIFILVFIKPFPERKLKKKSLMLLSDQYYGPIVKDHRGLLAVLMTYRIPILYNRYVVMTTRLFVSNMGLHKQVKSFLHVSCNIVCKLCNKEIHLRSFHKRINKKSTG